jgi:hypothetical protein
MGKDAIVVLEPAGEGLCALGRGVVRASIGPLAQRTLNEASRSSRCANATRAAPSVTHWATTFTK